MKLYFDTSIFVPLTTFELKTDVVQAWFSEQDPAEIAISDWVTTEFYSAMAFKLRTKQIDADLRHGAEHLFIQYTSQNFQTIEVIRDDFGRAASLAGDPSLKLRAGDALHLAITQRLGLELCTLDRHLFEAALLVGVRAFTL